jgi:hypothetical protein
MVTALLIAVEIAWVQVHRLQQLQLQLLQQLLQLQLLQQLLRRQRQQLLRRQRQQLLQHPHVIVKLKDAQINAVYHAVDFQAEVSAWHVSIDPTFLK